MAHHLAQFNIARALAPFDDPRMHDFVARLDEINKLAEGSAGFVWRLTSPDGRSSSYLQAYDDPDMLVNLSVWTSVEALRAFVFRTAHADLLRDRTRWFDHPPGPVSVMWWIPAGSRPTVEDGKAKLAELAAKGPTPGAFTFQRGFPPP